MKDIRESDLVKLGPCPQCGKKLFEGAASGLVPFYVVTVAQAITDPNALRRRAGLELQIGPLASIMGPDEALAKQLSGTAFILHQDCLLYHGGPLVPWMETVSDREKEEKEVLEEREVETRS